MQIYRLKPGKLGRKLQGIYRGMERAFVDTFLEPDGSLKTGPLGPAVTGAYRKVERGAVRGYKAVETAFVSTFLERDDDRKE